MHHRSRRSNRSRRRDASSIRDPPPLCLKVEGRGGFGIALYTFDLVAPIMTAEEVRPRFRTPPPPLRLKVERQGGSGILCAPLIRVLQYLPSKLDFHLNTDAFASRT
jgi:hypothetical protein